LQHLIITIQSEWVELLGQICLGFHRTN